MQPTQNVLTSYPHKVPQHWAGSRGGGLEALLVTCPPLFLSSQRQHHDLQRRPALSLSGQSGAGTPPLNSFEKSVKAALVGQAGAQ